MSTWAGVFLSVVTLLVFRGGVLPMRPAALAVLVALTALIALLTAVTALARQSIAGVLVFGGLLSIAGGGLANWLFSIQGYVLLTELEAVPLHGGSHLQDIETGALSDLEEMNLTLQLEELRLAPTPGGFLPVSRLRLIEKGREPVILEIARGRVGALRTLRFHQGAFGFAPRIVVTRNGDAVFDRHVPFTTRARDSELSFEGAFDLEQERLTLRGAIDLRTLDDALRGHPRIGIAVQRDGKPFGSGELAMGHFSRLDDGYAVGFAGLRRWSEIDIARRTYPQPMLAGTALILAGAVVWPFRRRKR